MTKRFVAQTKNRAVSFLSTLLIESAQKWHQSCSSFVAVMFIRCHCERSAKQWEAISCKNVPGRAERCGQDAASRPDSRRLIELGTVAEKWKANRISDVIPLSTPRGALLLTLRLLLLLLLRPEMRACSSSLKWRQKLSWRTQLWLFTRRSDLPQSLIVPSYFCVNRHKRGVSLRISIYALSVWYSFPSPLGYYKF